MSSTSLPVNISGQVVTVPSFATLPPAAQVPIGSQRVTADTGTLYINDGSAWNSAGGGGGITSINGSVVAAQTISGTAPVVVTSALGNTDISLSVATANVFLASNASNEVVGYAEWNLDETTKFSNVQILYQPNNLAVSPEVFNWNVNINPLQNSPNDSLKVFSINANLDSAATGFNMGTAGQAVTLVNGGFNYQGNGSAYGSLSYINLNTGFGNGTDPISFEGLTGQSLGFNTSAGITIDGGVNAYAFNMNLNAATVTTANFSFSGFTDFSTIPVDLYGYQGFVSQPSIDTVKNGTNYNGVIVNPTITDFEGNAGFYGLLVGGTITNQGTSNGYNGIQVNSTITNLTQNSTGLFVGCASTSGTGNWQGAALSTTNIVTTGAVEALNIATLAGHTAINSSGVHNLSSPLILASALGQMNGNSIGGSITVPDATAITGTDVFGNNMGYTVHTGDATSSFTPSGPVSISSLGFVGLITGDGTVNGAINFCLGGYSFMGNGPVARINNFYAAGIPGGGTGIVAEAVLFNGDMPFGLVGTDNWGLRIESSLENYVDKIAVGTSNKKVTAGNLIEVDGGDVALTSAGHGLKIKEGANARMGISTLVAGTVVVANTSVTASSRVLVSNNAVSGGVGSLSVALNAGVGFTINSTNVLDASSIAWFIVEPS